MTPLDAARRSTAAQDAQDDISAARAILRGALFSLPIWLALGVIWWSLT